MRSHGEADGAASDGGHDRGAKRPGRRRRARERALQFLFQIDLTHCSPDDALGGFWKQGRGGVDPAVREFTERLVRGVRQHREEIDRWIVGSAANWRLERMSVVDRNVLRLAVYEMLHAPETPAAVVIDEAIELGKRYGGEGSASFVNGVLDSIRERLETGVA